MKWCVKMLIGFLAGVAVTVIVVLLFRITTPPIIVDDERVKELVREIEIREQRIDSLQVEIRKLVLEYQKLYSAQGKIIEDYEKYLDSIVALSDDASVRYFLSRTRPDTD